MSKLAEELYSLFLEARKVQAKEHAAKRKPGLSISSLGSCDLRCQYIEWGMPRTNEDSEEGLWRLAVGNYIHKLMQDLSLKSGISNKKFQEKRVEVKSLGIGGSEDDLWIKENAVIDYKTMDAAGVRYGLPKEAHINQVHGYMAGLREEGLDIDKAFIYYIPKGNAIKFKPKYHKSVKESIPFTYDETGERVKCLIYEIPWDEKIHKDNVDKVKRIKEACKKFMKLPGVTDDKKKSWECRFCEFRDGCVGQKVTEFNKILQEMKK